MMSVVNQLMLALNLAQCRNDSQCTSKLKSPLNLFCLPLGLKGLVSFISNLSETLHLYYFSLTHIFH